MDRGDIRDAIMLFQYSNTGLQGGRARDVVRVLWDLYNSNEIGFHDLGRASLHATWNERRGHNLRLNTAYLETIAPAIKLGVLSLLLVHEGTHAADNFPKLYSELAARMLPILYFRELSGPGVFNEASDPPRPGQHTQTVWFAPSTMPSYVRQSDALQREQLIDYLLSIETYTAERYVNAQWVIDNLTNWRGLTNRWPGTRGLYIRVLAPTVDPYFTRAILDIMESVSSRADWDAMMAEAGSLRTIQIALDELSARPPYSARVVALERRWHVHLREDPPAH